jgi:succinylarginine dihydrolase
MKFYEVNFDGIVGPTHNYSGLSSGNIASTSNKATFSEPKAAALQGLQKMKLLMELGLKQAVLPPHERPHLETLRELGFSGKDSEIIEKCRKNHRDLFIQLCSASPMWTANAAMTSSSLDSLDKKCHFTVANLTSKFHRSFEHITTQRVLSKIFKSKKHFSVHEALPEHPFFGDEGSANFTRLCSEYGKTGVEIFTFGKYALDSTQPAPQKFVARQTFEACEAIARQHKLKESQTVFTQQLPEAIDGGVFHNDVICVGNENVLFLHEKAFLDQEKIKKEITEKFSALSKENLFWIEVKNSEISLQDCIKTYLFNSQLVTLKKGEMALIAPKECEDTSVVKNYLQNLIKANNPIKKVFYLDLKQSMRNGGGPACLRLRVVLNDAEIKNAHSGVFLTEKLFLQLEKWIHKYYPDKLSQEDLFDPKLYQQSCQALDSLSKILKLGTVYSFQK